MGCTARKPILVIAAQDTPEQALQRILCAQSEATKEDAQQVYQAAAVLMDGCSARRRLSQSEGELELLRRSLERTREEARAADRAKSEFLANVSHEIRTPMNTILGFTGLLMKEPLAADQQQKLRYVHEAATALLSLVNNVLDFSRLAAGQLKLRSAVFHLDALVHEVLEATWPSAREKRLLIEHHVPEAVPRWLEGDKMRLRQILVNLVHNSIKFTQQGTIHLQVALDEETPQTATLRAVVTDTGVGIPPDRQAVMFQSFSQADGSLTRQFGGLGLGLALCKQLVDLMGGQIGFRSEPGRGSSFWLTLGLKKHLGRTAETSPPSLAEKTSPPGGQPLGPADGPPSPPHPKPHVLVAESDPLNRTLAEMFLVRAGCLVDLAGSSREAWAALQQGRYDMVLMDVPSSEAEALRVIEQIRAEQGATGRRVRVFALVSCPDPGLHERCLQAGADGCLEKPLAAESIIDALQRYLPECLDVSGQERPEESAPGSGGRSGPQAEVEKYLQVMRRALEEKDPRNLEDAAGIVRKFSSQAQWKQAADHAMRVQLAARSGDLAQAAGAIRRLHAALAEQAASAPRANRLPSPCC